MTSFGLMELLLIGVVLLVAVGPERLPKVTRDVGRLYGRMRRAADDLRRALVLEADRADEEDRLRELRRKRAEAEKARKAAAEAKGEDGAAPAGPQPQRPPDAPPEPSPSPEEPSEGTADDDAIPPGFTAEDWAELPPNIRERIERRRKDP